MRPDSSFSVIIPAHNSEAYLEAAVASAIAAEPDPGRCEIIVIDDGSTDGTLELARALEKRHPAVRAYSKPNGNWGSVVNYAVANRLPRNDYVVVLDSDDVLHEKFFERARRHAKGADVLMMGLRIQGKRFRYYASPHYWAFRREVKPDRRFTPAFAPFSAVIAKALFFQAPKLAENVSYQDYFLFFALLQKAKTVRFTYASAGLYNKYRPGNTMGAPWSDARFAQELLLHESMRGIGLSETLVYRAMMSGYKKKAKEKNYRINMDRAPRAKWLPWYGRALF